MSKEERHLQTKIRMFEDILLRTKNPCQVDYKNYTSREWSPNKGSFFFCIVLPLRLF